MITHELKTPLTSIIGYSDMLNNKKMGELNDDQKFAVSEIYSSSIDLSKLIETILTLQKIESHQQKFHREKTTVQEFITNVNNRHLPLMTEKQIEFLHSGEEDFAIIIDKEKMMEVFANLIHNSVDFVPDSGGRIEISSKSDNSDVIFSVIDNGIGIPKDKLGNLFTKYYQVDTSMTRKHGGTGLGLAICKGIVEELGGKIWVESEEGKGTSMYFRMPKE
jgi:signal transduction histidine kinase